MAFSQAYIKSILSSKKATNGLKTAHADAVKKTWSSYADELVDEVYGHISAWISSFQRSQITARLQENGNDIKIIVSFSEDALWRDSLYQGEGTPSWRTYSRRDGKWGTDDIVLLFEKGWHASGSVYGHWKGHGNVWSRRSHDATNMLAQAIQSFNDRAPDGVEAQLLPPYK